MDIRTAFWSLSYLYAIHICSNPNTSVPFVILHLNMQYVAENTSRDQRLQNADVDIEAAELELC